MYKDNGTTSNDGQMAWDDLRSSPAFPAIVGGLAGALGGAVLMLVFSKLSAPKQTLPAAYDAEGNPMNVVYLPPPEEFRLLGFSIGDLITLGTVGLSLYRQIQDLRQGDDTDGAGTAAENGKAADTATVPASPSQKSAAKK